jgi:hypothetical protein
MTLAQQLNYMGKLMSQVPTHPTRVVYTKAGNSLAAACVFDRRTIIDHKLYWGAAASADEARYLVALLNAPRLTELVRPYQSIGAFGPRDFDKYVWHLAIPEFDATSELHRHLAALALQAEDVAATTIVPAGAGFQRARQVVRSALEAGGVSAALDAAVTSLLGEREHADTD